MFVARLLICLVIFQFKAEGVKRQGNPVCKNEVCDEYCPYGNVPDAHGCETCACFDPCTNYTCPADEECKRVAVVCIRAPCYPIAQCGLPCPLVNCASQCPYGYEVTKNGCETNNNCTCIDHCKKHICPSDQICTIEHLCSFGDPCGIRPKCIKKCPLSLPCHSIAKCPYGFELDCDGCQTCTCNDPCRDVICPQNQYCSVVVVNCLVAPCPPPSPQCVSYCPENSYLLTDLRNAPVVCSNNGKTCPRGYMCHYVPNLNASYCCKG